MESINSALNQFSRNDFISNLWLNRLKWHPYFGGLILSILIALPIILLAVHFNEWWRLPDHIGLGEDIGWWINLAVSGPITLGLLIWFPNAIRDLVLGLLDNKVLELGEKDSRGIDLEFHIRKYSRRFNGIVIHVFSLTAVILFFAFSVLDEHRAFQTWENGSPLLFLSSMYYLFVFFYLNTVLVLRLFATIVWIEHLFENLSINVNVFHPDGLGGLSPLAEFSGKTLRLIAAIGFSALMVTIAKSYNLTTEFQFFTYRADIVFFYYAYVPLAIFSFFGPLLPGKNKLVEAKKEMQTSISNQFVENNSKFVNQIKKNSAKYKDSFGNITAHKAMYAALQDIPDWPYQNRRNYSLVTTITLPFVLNGLPLLFQVLFRS